MYNFDKVVYFVVWVLYKCIGSFMVYCRGLFFVVFWVLYLIENESLVMFILNCVVEFVDDMVIWCYYLYVNLEFGFDCYEMVVFVVEWLKEFGVDEVYIGIVILGVVVIING